MKVPVSPQPAGWDVLHTKNSLIFDGPNIPEPTPTPLNAGGNSWQPGARFIFLGGHKTSAGFEWLDFRKTGAITYLGQITTQVNTAESPTAVFKQDGFTNPDGTPRLFGWHVSEGALFWGNASCSGRVIEMERATLEGQEIPPHNKALRVTRGKTRNWPQWHACGDCWHVERFENQTTAPTTCSQCGSARLDVNSSKRGSERPHFDEFQRTHGDRSQPAPPPPIED